MPEGTGNPWKMIAIGMALVVVTALVTGMVVASRTGTDDNGERTAARVVDPPPPPPPLPPASPAPRPVQQAAVPSAADVEICNDRARAAKSDRTAEVLKDVLIGGAVGAGVGAAGGAVADGGKGAGKGAGIGGLVGAAAGTLYGLNKSNEHDARSVEAYRACMRSRGHAV